MWCSVPLLALPLSSRVGSGSVRKFPLETIGAIAAARLEMGIVWSQMRPGPVSTVLNIPSPPRKMFLAPLTIWASMETLSSKPATLPVSTTICWPAASWYSTRSPSISAKAMPLPVSLCMMKPSPPKMPVLALLLKWVLSSTPRSAARNARFWRIQL